MNYQIIKRLKEGYIGLDEIYKDYNKFIEEKDYLQKYKLEKLIMFILDGMDKIKDKVEKNRV
ncbi:MAG: hypothetical protein ACK5LT_12455 [Lachnospirales bacterium]